MTKRKRQGLDAKPAGDVRAAAPGGKCRNRYKGHTLPDGGSDIDCITMQQALEADFINDYVRQRRPVLIQGIPPGVKAQLADPSFLRSRCGNSLVKVEGRGGDAGFGHGRSSMMKLHDFLVKWEAGEEGLYLTTQNLDGEEDEEDDAGDDEALPALMAPPLSDVMDCFPLRPRPLADLLPSSYNVWMGASRAGSSSGLHHDFHDNMSAPCSISPPSSSLLLMLSSSSWSHLLTSTLLQVRSS
jgi:hypothetical protein